jgi:uncharacterized protein YuzE
MKLHYYAKTESLYIEPRVGAAAETCEVASRLNVDLGEDGGVVGFDVNGASEKLDLATPKAIALPITSLRAARRAGPPALAI